MVNDLSDVIHNRLHSYLHVPKLQPILESLDCDVLRIV